ncbi:hypothetical protein LV779_26540 [Streptomyces thinghirensis]|nr:hypothetical protein [Streptomyces thinghirensis]
MVFTDPEAASVGLTLAEAEQAGHRVRAASTSTSPRWPARACTARATRPRARMVVDLEDEIVRGVTFVGPGVGEMIHSATVAVAGRVPISAACGTRSRRTRRSARYGCGCWRTYRDN